MNVLSNLERMGKRLLEDNGRRDLPFNLKHRKMGSARSFPKKYGASFEENGSNMMSLEHDLRTPKEVNVEYGNCLNYSSVGHISNHGETNGERGIIDMNQMGKDCDLKDVALKYDANINIWIKGGDTEPRIDDQNRKGLVNHRIFDHKEGAFSLGETGKDCNLKDVALMYDTNIKAWIEEGDTEHDLRTMIEVTVEAKDYLNYSSVGYSTNQGFTDLNEGALSLVETGKDCCLKDVALKYDANIKICVSEDITGGKERIPIRAMNEVDYSQPPTFTYVNQMVYPSWYKKIEPKGCGCVRGCSESRKCICIVKNGEKISFNENGCIVKARARVHECGPKCKCPSTCMNRVSQRGPQVRLEIFKTENRGWGVRSRDLIQSGGFVGEYIGEFLTEKDADLRVGGDEYLFDVWRGSGAGKSGNGFSIDAGVYGNVGRFFNHSCSPNMYAQKVIYDHDDHRMPHIVFFATRDIPPMDELCYDYNYRLGSVCDVDGNVKTKECYCGSRKCRKRLY